MSKKVLNSCKVLFFIFFSAAIFAQTKSPENQESLVMPSMPSMPSVSQPSIGSGFYSPGRSDFYSGKKNQNQRAATKTSQNQANSSKTENSSATGTSQNTAQTNAQKLNTIAKSASSSLNQLTADDISSMNNLGILGSLSGLLGKGNSSLQSQLLSNQGTVTANTVDSATLQQILSELTDLKNKLADGTTVVEKSAGENAFSNVVTKEPKILRFIVNGYDILSTCKKIYFSEIETDGTFLLTGDRKYISENKTRTETFYFYFRASGSDNGITKYVVTPAVSQDYENQYSYLYQLTQKSDITADRTGNLVTLRISDDGWNMDLLISLDK